MNLLDRILPGSFGDFDLPALDDAWLDSAFAHDEQLLGARGLVSTVPNGGRIPWEQITPWAKFVPGWSTRGAPVMRPVAWMIHWTASKPSKLRPAPAYKIVLNGRPDVPGPLSQLYLDWSGQLWVMASGRANHAGLGDPAVRDALVHGSLTARQPKGKSSVGSGGLLIGIEVEHSGDPQVPYPAPVLAELVRIDRAIRAHYGWGAMPARTIDHARWAPDRKIDCVSHRREIVPLRWLIAA